MTRPNWIFTTPKGTNRSSADHSKTTIDITRRSSRRKTESSNSRKWWRKTKEEGPFTTTSFRNKTQTWMTVTSTQNNLKILTDFQCNRSGGWTRRRNKRPILFLEQLPLEPGCTQRHTRWSLIATFQAIILLRMISHQRKPKFSIKGLSRLWKTWISLSSHSLNNRLTWWEIISFRILDIATSISFKTLKELRQSSNRYSRLKSRTWQKISLKWRKPVSKSKQTSFKSSNPIKKFQSLILWKFALKKWFGLTARMRFQFSGH